MVIRCLFCPVLRPVSESLVPVNIAATSAYAIPVTSLLTNMAPSSKNQLQHATVTHLGRIGLDSHYQDPASPSAWPMAKRAAGST